MIFTILIMILFLIVISVVFVFIFDMLVASLRAQNISFNKPIFSENEIRVKPSLMETYDKIEDKKAVVMCSAKKDISGKRFYYDGPKNCALFASMTETEHDCKYGCIGFGDCAAECSRNAIHVVNGTAVVNSLCNGCGKCIGVCPKKIIKLIPVSTKTAVLCSAEFTEKNGCSEYLKESEIEQDTAGVMLSDRIFSFFSFSKK